ncbi:MAG: hypothetical protein U0Q03_11070 [Acidimicrobiales bacterium]
MSVLVLAVMLLLPIRAGGERTDGPHLWLVLNLTIAVVLVLYVLLSLGVQLAGVDADAPELAQHLAAHPEQQRLLTRWLERARWARFVGGFAGVVACVLATNFRGSLLLFGTAGIYLGAMIAELHHARRPAGPRAARLEVRRVSDYLTTRDLRWMVGVAVVAAALGFLGAWDADTRTAMWWGLAVLAVLALTRLMQQRVASRARPAVSPELTRADDLARELAIGRGLARPATYLGLAMLAEATDSLTSLLGDLATFLGTVCWFTAAVLWWQNRRLGLDFLKENASGPVIA